MSTWNPMIAPGKNRHRRNDRWRLQRCTECGHEGFAFAVLHLQAWFPCPVCQRTTRREYADSQCDCPLCAKLRPGNR